MESKLIPLLKSKLGWAEDRARKFVADLNATPLSVIKPILTDFLEEAPPQ